MFGCHSLILNNVIYYFFHSCCLSLGTLTADHDWWRTGFCHTGRSWHGLWWVPLFLPSTKNSVCHVSWSYELHTKGLKAMRHTPQGAREKEGKAWLLGQSGQGGCRRPSHAARDVSSWAGCWENAHFPPGFNFVADLLSILRTKSLKCFLSCWFCMG